MILPRAWRTEGDDRPMPRGYRLMLALGALVLMLGLVAAACGGDEEEAATPAETVPAEPAEEAEPTDETLPGASAPLAEAAAGVARWSEPLTEFEPSGPPFDGRAAAQGKTIGWVSVTTGIPFTQEMMRGARPAADLIGLEISLCDGKGQASEWARCYQRFISEGVDIILSQSIDPRILEGPIQDANAAGIPVMTTSSNFVGEELWTGTVAEVAQPFREVGQLTGEFAVAHSNGNVNALIIMSDEVYVGRGHVEAIEAEFERYCPETCTARVENIPISDWATRIQTVVQSLVQANPDINYVIPLYDGMAPFVIAGVHAANAQDRVEAISFNATAGVMDFLKRRDVLVGEVGVWVIHHGWGAIDQAARVLAGERDTPSLTDPKTAMRMFTYENVDTLDFDNPDTWYGPLDIEAFYKQQWMIDE